MTGEYLFGRIKHVRIDENEKEFKVFIVLFAKIVRSDEKLQSFVFLPFLTNPIKGFDKKLKERI